MGDASGASDVAHPQGVHDVRVGIVNGVSLDPGSATGINGTSDAVAERPPGDSCRACDAVDAGVARSVGDLGPATGADPRGSRGPEASAGRIPRIVYCDDWLLVVDKPAGLLSVPGRGPEKADCLAARLQALHPEARVVHRLDEATSGLMLFARHAEAQRRLGAAFERRAVLKRYVAMVDGRPTAARGRIALPLAADWPRRPLQRVDFERGRPSHSDWIRLEAPGADADACRLALRPHTGRSHQLRVHLAAMGHPILGDALYAPPAVRARAPRLLLHASRLRLPHPAGDGRVLDCASRVPF